MNKCERVEV